MISEYCSARSATAYRLRFTATTQALQRYSSLLFRGADQAKAKAVVTVVGVVVDPAVHLAAEVAAAVAATAVTAAVVVVGIPDPLPDIA